MNNASRLRQNAFHEVYQIPAMRKINQAIGRLVRAPEHEATILLHCNRFGEDSFQALLNPQSQPSLFVENEADFQKWLHSRYGY